MNRQVLDVLLPLAIPSVWFVDIDTRSVGELVAGDVDDQAVDFSQACEAPFFIPQT